MNGTSEEELSSMLRSLRIKPPDRGFDEALRQRLFLELELRALRVDPPEERFLERLRQRFKDEFERKGLRLMRPLWPRSRVAWALSMAALLAGGAAASVESGLVRRVVATLDARNSPTEQIPIESMPRVRREPPRALVQKPVEATPALDSAAPVVRLEADLQRGAAARDRTIERRVERATDRAQSEKRVSHTSLDAADRVQRASAERLSANVSGRHPAFEHGGLDTNGHGLELVEKGSAHNAKHGRAEVERVHIGLGARHKSNDARESEAQRLELERARHVLRERRESRRDERFDTDARRPAREAPRLEQRPVDRRGGKSEQRPRPGSER